MMRSARDRVELVQPQSRLQTMASVYFGYHATRSIAEVIVGTLYGAVDGLIAGAVFAWLYNQLAKPGD